ncbi:MAG TPA: TetR/AcrR family transcriptional regulator [Acidimicrobiia bacterium]|nr:TetR/AcrR family transcriptional regulator [Acidimicrobiia bacterium]
MTFEPLTPERRRAMTRQHLLDAAAVVFAKNGFHGSTLDEVAATAGFTKGAVYSNFKSKDDLFLALLDERINREFAVFSDVLEQGRLEDQGADQLPRVRELLHGLEGMSGGDTWTTLYLEFVLYARHNPEAQAKLTATARRERDLAQKLIENEYAAIGEDPTFSTREMAAISVALFNGLGLERLADPDAVTETTIDTMLGVLFDAIGIDPDTPSESPVTEGSK